MLLRARTHSFFVSSQEHDGSTCWLRDAEGRSSDLSPELKVALCVLVVLALLGLRRVLTHDEQGTNESLVGRCVTRVLLWRSGRRATRAARAAELAAAKAAWQQQ